MSNVQLSNSSCERPEHSCNQIANRKLAGSRCGHGKHDPFQYMLLLTLQTEKVFDIACAVADVLPFIDVSTSQVELGPVDYLTQVVSVLAKLPGGSTKFVPLLLAKINELRPELVHTLGAASQLPLTAFNNPMSPATQFLYEEEVSTGLYADLRRAL